jgi:hypothetical protein
MPGRSPFPSTNAEWNYANGLPRLQWRDRAGLAPDFPIKPFLGAPQVNSVVAYRLWMVE